MKKIVFTEEFCQPANLFPFTLTRQVQDIRVGILTIRQKWELYLGLTSFDQYEEDYKDIERPIVLEKDIGKDTVYLIHGNILPTRKLVRQTLKLKPGECISVKGIEHVVYCISKKEILDKHKIKIGKVVDLDEEVVEIKYPWDILKHNKWALDQDLQLLHGKVQTQSLSGTNKLIKEEKVFVEKGATIEHCILNTSEGPIYIGQNAKVMEGSMLRGPLAICNNAFVKMGTRIYGTTTIGPGCVVGGEIKNSVFFGFSNKAHDGYIGDSVIGEWCNLGAGTSNSNVKNNASTIVVWTPNGPVNVGTKCGVLMGDYSRTAINTSLNTGTVVGVCANIFGSGLSPKYIPNFSWGSDGVERYNFEKALADINNWKVLKDHSITDNEKTILKHIFEHY